MTRAWGKSLSRQQFCKMGSGEFHTVYSDPDSAHHTIANKKNKKEEKRISQCGSKQESDMKDPCRNPHTMFGRSEQWLIFNYKSC